jgi:hypothetical protein
MPKPPRLDRRRRRAPVCVNRCPYARAREAGGGNNNIDLLDPLEPAVWRCAGGRAGVFVLAQLLFADSGRRWRLGGERRR